MKLKYSTRKKVRVIKTGLIGNIQVVEHDPSDRYPYLVRTSDDIERWYSEEDLEPVVRPLELVRPGDFVVAPNKPILEPHGFEVFEIVDQPEDDKPVWYRDSYGEISLVSLSTLIDANFKLKQEQ